VCCHEFSVHLQVLLQVGRPADGAGLKLKHAAYVVLTFLLTCHLP
jgi:hypothetical protein